jgi:hypothetical protein
VIVILSAISALVSCREVWRSSLQRRFNYQLFQLGLARRFNYQLFQRWFLVIWLRINSYLTQKLFLVICRSLLHHLELGKVNLRLLGIQYQLQKVLLNIYLLYDIVKIFSFYITWLIIFSFFIKLYASVLQ